MNTTQHHSNGSSANGAASQRGKIYFGESTQIVTLETEPAQATQSEGNWGPQYTYRLAGNLITWLDPPQHQTLLELGAHAGDEVAFTKRKKGSRNVWDILRVEEEPAPAPPPSRFSTIGAPRPAPPAPALNTPLKSPVSKPDRSSERISGNLMAAALKQAIEACELAEFHAAHEDVRALAITIYIHGVGGKQK